MWPPLQSAAQLHHRDPLCYLFSATAPAPPYPQTPTPGNRWSVSHLSNFVIARTSYKGNLIQYVTFWLTFPLSIIPLKSIQVVACINNQHFFHCYRSVVFHGKGVSVWFIIHPLKNIGVVFRFGPFGIKLLWIFMYRFLCEHKFSFLWDECWRGRLLGCVVSTCLFFKETILLFPEWVCHCIYVPTSNVWPIRFLYSLRYLLLLFILVILIDVCNETSLWFLVAFSWWLMMLNIFSWACLPSVHLPWSICSCPLPIFWLFFVLMNFESSVCILDTSPLSDMRLLEFLTTSTKEKNQYNLPGLLTWPVTDLILVLLCPPETSEVQNTHTHKTRRIIMNKYLRIRVMKAKARITLRIWGAQRTILT